MEGMPLTLLTGPANSAKAGVVFDAYAAAVERRGAFLVVPTSPDATHYARELAPRTPLGSVLTFGGLIAEIARRTGIPYRVLTPFARRRVLQRAVAGAHLDLLAESAQSPGFAGAVGELITELGRAMVTPQRFAQALSAWAALDSRRECYARELGSLPLTYFGELDRLGCVDEELAARRSLDARRRAPARWGQTAVLFYGFDDLTELERDSVETLSRIADVTVSLTYEPAREALSARAEVVQELRPLAERVIELPALDDHYAPAAREALHHLERSLFEPDALCVPAGCAVRVLEAGSERAEAELIAAEVGAILQEGIRPDEIVVVARHPGRVAPLLGEVFAEYGLALTTDDRGPLVHTALGRALRALGRCAWAPDATADDLLA